MRYPHGLFSASDAVLQPTFFFLPGALLEIQLHPQTMQRRSEFLSPRERVYSTASFEIIFEYSCCVLQKKEMKGCDGIYFSPHSPRSDVNQSITFVVLTPTVR